MTNERLLETSSGVLTVAEIAALFRQDRETVKRHARNGTLPGFKLGKSWFFRWSDIDQMMKDAISTRRESN